MAPFQQAQPAHFCPRCSVMLPPNTATCYNCGYTIAPFPLNSAPVSTQPPGTLTKNRARQDRSREQKRAALIYFTCIFFAVALLTISGIHASGVSLSSLISHPMPPPHKVTYPIPKGTPLFADPFVNDLSGWNLHSSHGNYAVQVGNGSLTLDIEKQKLLWEMLPGERSYSDFTLSINAVLAQGDQNNGYGVYIRGTANGQTDLATYYRFELYGDASYAIFKGTVDASGKSSSVKIAGYTLNSAIQKQGKSNQMMIIARGASLSFIVNGQLLQTVIDHSYSSGSIALFVSNLPQAKPGAEVQFSQLGIYP
jgi:hypothetical protein